jgi:hypothetical protein
MKNWIERRKKGKKEEKRKEKRSKHTNKEAHTQLWSVQMHTSARQHAGLKQIHMAKLMTVRE